MKTVFPMYLTVQQTVAATGIAAEMSNLRGYIVGVIIALILLAYLVYSLIKPEKF